MACGLLGIAALAIKCISGQALQYLAFLSSPPRSTSLPTLRGVLRLCQMPLSDAQTISSSAAFVECTRRRMPKVKLPLIGQRSGTDVTCNTAACVSSVTTLTNQIP
ncbi:hypothetical protein EDC04DRAFT_2709278 [Pisolithus marmoratus]|nr:hypothetical protein EDC04DRAFT_2709278 [Pisolithus marmoratus]